jgi:hypothetical protein
MIHKKILFSFSTIIKASETEHTLKMNRKNPHSNGGRKVAADAFAVIWWPEIE